MNKLNYRIWLWILFSYVVFAVPEMCFDGKGLVSIDSTKSLCCDGVYDRKNSRGVPQQCCLTNTTDVNGQMVSKAIVFNIRDKLCCGGLLVSLSEFRGQPKPKCCGDVLIDHIRDFCCNDIVYSRSGQYAGCYRAAENKEFPVREEELVCDKYSDDGTSRSYKIHQKIKGWECCGTDYFNEAENHTHFCFEDRFWEMGTQVSTCARKPFDISQYACCDKKYLIPTPNISNAKYLGTAPQYDCFNGTLIDRDLYQIATVGNMETVIPNNFLPCGNSYYDPNNKRTQTGCCNGVINYAHLHLNVACCKDEFIDTDKFTCCNDTKIPVTSTLGCCGNKVYDRLNGLECCGTGLIDSSYLCCMVQTSRYVPVKKGAGHNKCCGIQTYNIREKQCCGGEVKTLEQNQICSPHTGQIINITQASSGELESQIKNSSSVRLPGRGNVTRNQDNQNIMKAPNCRACNKTEEVPANCEKKFGHMIFVKDIIANGSNTLLNVLVLDPPIVMVLWTQGQCRCYEKSQLYIFYTNRKLISKMRTSSRLQLRFSPKDIFSIVTGKFPNYSAKKCKINRYLKKRKSL